MSKAHRDALRDAGQDYSRCPICGEDQHFAQYIEPYDFCIPCYQAGRASPPEPVDAVNHPSHYKSHPSGIECIQITEHMGFCLGNAVKYIWRADLKDDAIQDLQKAAWYINREIEKRQGQAGRKG